MPAGVYAMVRRTFCAAILGVAARAATKSPATGRGENETVRLLATVYNDKEEIKKLLGSDLGGNFIVVEMKVTPRGANALDLQIDDFLLKTYKDGDRAKPFMPSQIAGRGSLVVRQTSGGGGGVMGESGGPIWGGIGGGAPRRMGGNGGGFGNSGSEEGVSATVNTGAKDKANPLMGVLQEKMLPVKKTEEPVTGLLYFPMDIKQKMKDLELVYSSPGGKVVLTFR